MLDTREARGSASELKFLVAPSCGDAVRSWARSQLDPDPHGHGHFGDEYATTSLYFDTAGQDVFHRRGSFGKAKYRIRRYGNADVVFFERKLRTSGMVVKRRTLMPLEVLARLEGPESEHDWSGYWFHRRLRARGLRPVCQLSYRRMARGVLVDNGVARLTLDDQIQVAAVAQAHFNGQGGVPVLDQRMILELKFRGHLPALFKTLIEELKLTAGPVSKYRIGMMALGHAPAIEQGRAPKSDTHA
jgi:hypothetical protein